MRTLEYLVSGHYRQAAKLVRDTDTDAALVFYLTKADPLLVLRDLLGHSTVLTTEKYLKRLDTTRIYRQAYETAGAATGLVDDHVSRSGRRMPNSVATTRQACDADDGDSTIRWAWRCVFSDGLPRRVRPVGSCPTLG